MLVVILLIMVHVLFLIWLDGTVCVAMMILMLRRGLIVCRHSSALATVAETARVAIPAVQTFFIHKINLFMLKIYYYIITF